MKDAKLKEAVFDCYRELFAKSTPVGDFDQLLENAEINKMGQKVIPFDEYEIEEPLFQQIIQDTIKKHKVPKRLHNSFSITIHLGCSPRFKRDSINFDPIN